MSNNLASQLYSGVADLGKARAASGLVVGIIVCILFFTTGFYAISLHDTRTTSAIINNTKCTYDANNAVSCLSDLTFNVDKKTYYSSLNENKYRNKGDTIIIKYNPSEPSNIISNDSLSSQKFGSILMVVGILFLLCTIGMYYFTYKYKPIAAMQGIDTIGNIGQYLTN